MKVAHICLFALFATAIFATPVVEEDQSDITIPSTHGYLIVEEGDVYLYVEEGDEDIYLYYESFTQDDEIVIAFDDPTGGGVAGISVTIEEDADGFCNKVTVMDLEFEEEDVWLEDSGTTIEDYVVALDAKAPQLCVVQITLTAGDETAVGDVTTDGADYVTGVWYSSLNPTVGNGNTDISSEVTLDISAAESFFTNMGTVEDGDEDLLGNYRFNLWNGIWWGEGDEDNLISVVTNQDDSYWQIGVDGEEDAQIWRVIRVGAHFTIVLYDGDEDEVGLRDEVTFESSTVSADYEDYAFVQFTIETDVGDFEEDEDYTIGYGTAIDDLTTEDVTLFETDFTTAGTTDTDAGTFVSGAAAASADEDVEEDTYSVAVRYEVDEDDITFDVNFEYEGLAADFRGSVLFDMGDEEDADVLTFWWLSDFHVPAMENFNGAADEDLTVADEDLKDNWSWVAYDVVIGESARFAVSRAVAAPDSDVDVSFAGDDFSFSWVYYEGGDRNEFETNSPFDAVTVEFPEEEEEEEESEGGESEESEEESDSASMIVSSIVSLLSLFVIFA